MAQSQPGETQNGMVLAIGEAAHAWHRHRTRSAASDPTTFALPVLPSDVDVPISTPQSRLPAPSCPTPAPSAPNLSGFLGRSIGNGQCVALARAVQPGLGPTVTWTAGASVQGNTALRVGYRDRDLQRQ